MSIKVIGLCGGSGSGKSLVSSFFSDYGYEVIDTDDVYHKLTEKSSDCLNALVCEFGAEILSSSGALDRSALRKIVFQNEEKRLKLNVLSHKFVLREVRNIIDFAKQAGIIGAIVDAPLLYESGFDAECDFVVAVISDKEKRIERIMNRDKISKNEALLRINSQIPDSELLEKADFVVYNNGETKDIKRQVESIISKIK